MEQTIKEVTIGRKFNLGNFESLEIRATAEISCGADVVIADLFNEASQELNAEILRVKEQMVPK